MGSKGLHSKSRKENEAAFRHLLAGTYGQFSAPFWQLWKISKRAGKEAKTNKQKAKMIIQEKYMAPEGKALSTWRGFGHAGVLPETPTAELPKEYTFCK